MVAGTSTGGIIALALASDMTASQALQIYVERGERIFPRLSGWRRWGRLLRWLWQPKHDQATLKSELLSVFDDKLIDDASIRLVVPSFEGRHGEPFLYKTPHHPDYQKDRHCKFAHVALHTTAAPTYYPGVEDDGYIMIGGGVWANNPVMNAVVDVLACYDISRENIRVLSLGTGDAAFKVKDSVRQGGVGHWAFLRAFTAAARAQSLNALGQAYLLLGKPNLVRIDPPESSNPITLNDVRRSPDGLPLMAKSLAEGSGHHVADLFLRNRAEPSIRVPNLDPIL